MAEAEGVLQIVVAWSPAPGQVCERSLRLPQGATLAQALVACGLDAAMPCGIWGRSAPPQRLLRPGDRVESYRPLVADPKTARRQRFQRQGARTAGLFAKPVKKNRQPPRKNA